MRCNRTLSQDPGNTQALENYWVAHRIPDEEIDMLPDLPTDSPIDARIRSTRRQSTPNAGGQRRNRTVSTVSALAASGQNLNAHHPAISLPPMIEVFGPLIFPLYKAALLRKRILLVTQAPVETACKYGTFRSIIILEGSDVLTVYNLSVISSIPSSIAGVLPLEPLPLRLRSLFSVGVHDIHLLRQVPPGHSSMPNGSGDERNLYGWIACTTDGILATKEKLYDMIVTMPPCYTEQAKERVWPKLQFSHDEDVKATQRDLRRYQTLMRELRKWPSKSQAPSPQPENHSFNFTDNEEPSFLPPKTNPHEFYNDNVSNADEKVVELSSWSSLAYSSFMWWASAGEKRTDLDEEVDHDARLLRGNNGSRNPSPSRSISRPRSAMSHRSEQLPGLEMTLIAYFYRLTTLILGTLADIVEFSEDETDEGVPGLEEVISITSEDVSRMGLDVWSAGDRRFVEELVELYWGRKAEVQRAKVECCGVRIC